MRAPVTCNIPGLSAVQVRMFVDTRYDGCHTSTDAAHMEPCRRWGGRRVRGDTPVDDSLAERRHRFRICFCNLTCVAHAILPCDEQRHHGMQGGEALECCTGSQTFNV